MYTRKLLCHSGERDAKQVIDKSSVAAVDREGLSSVKVLLRSESCPRVETRGNELERQEVAVRIWDA